MNDAIDVVVQSATGHVDVLLVGALSMRTVAVIRTWLVELLADAGCVVADVSRLELRHPGCVAVFAAALHEAGGWPRAKLALIGADPRLLTHLATSADRAVPVADSIDAALVMADRPPRPIRSPLSVDDEHVSPIAAIARMRPETAQFIQDWLGVLIEHDVRERSELVATLAAFLQHNHEYSSTASALGIHHSTARYRIHRITQITQLNIFDLETAQHVRAAMRAFAQFRRGHGCNANVQSPSRPGSSSLADQ